MRNLLLHKENKLSELVFSDKYFSNELENQDFLIALCREEFIFTDNQLQHLKTKLFKELNK